MTDLPGAVVLENAELIFRNFSGIARPFNSEGDRNFCILLNEEQAMALREQGWNVKQLRQIEEGDPLRFTLKVNVKYVRRDGTAVQYPPQIFIITSRGKTPLDESTVGVLDLADIREVDLSFNPSRWEARGESGISAYLKSMWVTVNEDVLELKYMDVPGDSDPEPEPEEEGAEPVEAR